MMEGELKQDQTEDLPRKRLLTDPNPKQSFITESLESTVSFDSSSDRLPKKTRELPNLSDCHSCGVRINYTNPRERLQPLDSMWRIVLLCKKCTKRVSNSDLCTYCFSDVVDENDCFMCRDCQHSVHKDCVERYGSGLGFTVCVDCWVPEVIAKSLRAKKRKRKCRERSNESCEQIVRLPESRVFDGETNEPDSFVAVAAKGSDIALKKAVVGKNEVEIAVVAGRKVAAGCEATVVDDAELAFFLHRAINSSPRISRYSCLVSSYRKDDAPIVYYSRRRAGKKIVLMNSSSLDVPIISYYRRRGKDFLSNSSSLNAPLMCYSRRRSGCKACSHGTECECCICKASNHGSTSSAGLMACNPSSTSENSLSGNSCQENDVGRKPLRYLLKYYRVGKGKPRPSVVAEDSGCSCMDSANLYTEGMPDTKNNGNGNECLEISENCDDNTDRFLLKYKRFSRYKARI